MSYMKNTVFGTVAWLCVSSLMVCNYASAEEPSVQNPAQPSSENTQATLQPDENGFYSGLEVYVSDNVNALLRSGPGSNYRTTGVLHPGDQVTFLGYSRDKRFAQIQSNGDTLWMRAADLQAKPAAVNQLASLKHELENTKAQLKELQSADSGRELEQLKAEITGLKQENEKLHQVLSSKDSEIGNISSKLSEQNTSPESRELDMQMRWWVQGALIALGGALVGIFFMLLPRPRRQRRDRY